jgi:uncharacterized protein
MNDGDVGNPAGAAGTANCDGAHAGPMVSVGPEARATAGERIAAIDVLRGVAVLCILPMNVASFALPEVGLMDPRAIASMFPYEGLNRLATDATHLLFEMKWMSVFAMLFGAGALLYSRAPARPSRAGQPLHSVAFSDRRSQWMRRCGLLMALGMLHAYFIWHGDILVLYGLCGLLIVWWCRSLRPGALLALGCLGVLIAAAMWSGWGWAISVVESRMASDPSATGAFAPPSAEALRALVERFRGNWLSATGHRVQLALWSQVFMIPLWGIWRAGGLMLIGMALLKWRVLDGSRPARFYAWMAGLGYGTGLPVVAAGIALGDALASQPALRFIIASKPNELGSVVVALGHVGLVMLAVRRGWLMRAQRAMAAVGRMALSNYILQSILCALIFYGDGLGLHGRLDRAEQWLVVLAVWATQIALTLAWARWCVQGPLEWLWKSATIGRRVPLRVARDGKG